jgi:transcriptional regulator with XRE-family HTH domain
MNLHEMIDKAQIGDRLKQLRLASNLSQNDIAQKLNTHQNAISRIENGQGGTLDLLFELVNFYSDVFYVGNFFQSNFVVILNSEIDNKELRYKDLIVSLLKEHMELTDNVYSKISAILEDK